jgi:hypothetical protein
MQVTMERKAEGDFMTIHPRLIVHLRNALFGGILLFLFSVQSCKPDLSDDPIPYVPFDDIVINLTLPTYIGLATDGGYAYVSGGVKGIIVYRKNSSTYLAFERNCTFQPNDACATVDVHVTISYMHNDGCCDSHFSFEGGLPISGPAWRPLQQYRATLSSNTLTITDEIVE